MAAKPLEERVLDCTDPEAREQALSRAADEVRAGRIVVLPTDTVYGVGADAFDAVAVAMVLAAKHRGREMPPPVLVPDPRTVEGLAVDVPMYARILMRQFWPGALTLVLRAQPSLQWDLGETNGTVALRMPDDEVALGLLSQVGPMAITSANLSGRPAARTAAEAVEQLGGAVGIYLDDGERSGGRASTILDCTGTEPVLLRAGALPVEELRSVLGTTTLHTEPVPPEELPRTEPEVDPVDSTTEGETPGTQPEDGNRAAGPSAAAEESGAHLVGSMQGSGLTVPHEALRIVPAPDPTLD